MVLSSITTGTIIGTIKVFLDLGPNFADESVAESNDGLYATYIFLTIRTHKKGFGLPA